MAAHHCNGARRDQWQGSLEAASLPGLTRQSIYFRRQMDARVKPAHDELNRAAN